MSNALFIPVKRVPRFKDLLKSMVLFLSEFFPPAERTTIGINLVGDLDLLNSLIFVQNHEQELFCWVSFSKVVEGEGEESENDLPIMAQVITKSEKSYLFSITVSYAIGMELGGRVIYDDAHIYFEHKRDCYSILEAKEYIISKI